MTRLIFLAALLFFSPVYAAPFPQIKNCHETSQSNVESSLCLRRELDKLNQKMEEAYKLATGHAHDHDEVLTMIHGGDLSYDQSNIGYLEKSQKQFIEYRETECMRQRVAMDIGSMAGHKQTACEIKLTLQRLEELDPFNELKDDKK